MTRSLACWCGCSDLAPFSPEYLRCTACGTLVTATMPAADITAVSRDEHGFYGREYWFSHQTDDLGYTDITRRARADLGERCVHWLRALLKYAAPPGRTLELGSAHGGFVALMRWAGFEASGLELSPWVVDFARQAFDVPMLLGPLEAQSIAPGSLDAIALMDVLEHLPDPVGTMRRAVELLKPEGFLLVQTPRFDETTTYDGMVASRSPFLEQLKSEQHLYLFTQRSVAELFRRLGAGHLVFEPAIFAHYDMFFVASRVAIEPRTPEAIEAQLTASATGRLVMALLDLDVKARQADTLARQLAASEADRAARLEVIEQQGSALGRVPQLEAALAASEADRAARLELIHKQGAEVVDLRRRLEVVRHAIRPSRAESLARLARPDQWQTLQAILRPAAQDPGGGAGPGTAAGAQVPLEEYIRGIDRFNRAQSNAPLLDAIRAYNHSMIDALNQSRPLRGRHLLDIGASPHGYALERALRLDAAEYVGIGLDVHEPVEVSAQKGVGRLLAMNAEDLDFPDGRFDLVLSISTFEHVSDPARVLAEIARVLKPGGSALISFEPIWTCSYGHHLHHFGPVSQLMPDWAHLLWDKDRMLRELAAVWPADAVLSLEEAARWVYDSDAINRIPIGRMREILAGSPLTVEWISPMPDQPRDPARARDVASQLAMSVDDLMTKGLSVLLNKR